MDDKIIYFTIFIFIFIIIILQFVIYKFTPNENTQRENFTSGFNPNEAPKSPVCNNLDGRCYLIDNTHDVSTNQRASEMLAEVNRDIIKLLHSMKKKYIDEDNLLSGQAKINFEERAFLTTRMLHLYNPENFEENRPLTSENTSFVVNKGDIISLCLRGALTEKSHIISHNVLIFVALHELTHIATETWSHKQPFWSRFKIILQEAVECGIYQPVNYALNPVNYCTLDITYNPLYDINV
jgi:hypothetical protein